MSQHYIRPEYHLSETTGKIIGAAKRVHGELEVIYQRALELSAHGLDFARLTPSITRGEQAK